jgi:osmotically-inducible protein OsmY
MQRCIRRAAAIYRWPIHADSNRGVCLRGRAAPSTRPGWVKLTGEVEWDYQRRSAEASIRGLSGIKGITNKIAIKAKAVQPSEIKLKIEDALKRAAEREADRIGIEVHGTRVTLSGKVRSFAELRDVRGAAFSAPGVTTVEDSELTVAA